MVIAVNAIFWAAGNKEGYGFFVEQIFTILIHQYPEHQFILVADRPFEEEKQWPANVQTVVVGSKTKHAFSFKWWYDIALPMAIKKHKANVLVQPFGFCSLTTKVPQLLVIHDLAFKHYPQYIAPIHRWYYQYYTKKFIQKATAIATVSEFSKQDIIQYYPAAKNKIAVVYSAVKKEFIPINEEEKQAIKNKYAEGEEYFLFTGGIHPRKNIMALLKAFSVFKKWQKSNMKLLIVGRLAWQYEAFQEKLNSYKYRNDVKLLGYIDTGDLATITASAYAAVYPSLWEGFGVPILEAMQCGTPIITGNNSSLTEIGGDAALYADVNQPDDIAKQMMLLYKDENLRSKQIEKGYGQASKFSWEKTAALMWNQIEAVSKN